MSRYLYFLPTRMPSTPCPRPGLRPFPVPFLDSLLPLPFSSSFGLHHSIFRRVGDDGDRYLSFHTVQQRLQVSVVSATCSLLLLSPQCCFLYCLHQSRLTTRHRIRAPLCRHYWSHHSRVTPASWTACGDTLPSLSPWPCVASTVPSAIWRSVRYHRRHQPYLVT